MIIKTNSLMLIRSFCSCSESHYNISDFILYKLGTNVFYTKLYNLFPLFVFTKLLFFNVSISLLKDTLYNESFWLCGFEASIRIYLKFRLNFLKRSISK